MELELEIAYFFFFFRKAEGGKGGNSDGYKALIMEANVQRDPERPKHSDEESNRPILPPLRLPSNQQSHRITNFYIDNILRPDFGHKRKARTLVREGLGVIIQREDLPGGKSSKTADPQQVEAEGKKEETGAFDNQHLGTEARRPDLIAGDVCVKTREGGGDGCLSTHAGSSSAPKAMLWPAWVYCTRYSDRPSSGKWKLLRPLAFIEK